MSILHWFLMKLLDIACALHLFACAGIMKENCTEMGYWFWLFRTKPNTKVDRGNLDWLIRPSRIDEVENVPPQYCFNLFPTLQINTRNRTILKRAACAAHVNAHTFTLIS